MAADEKWYFTKEQLASTPSTKCGYDVDRELSCRQQAAHLIQDMGQRLQVSQLCINTAIVYMHRFYVFHSFTQFHLDAMAAASLFLAAKVEEQPRKLEHVIRVKQICLHRDQPALDVKSEQYLEQAQDLVFNENVLLQTLGFDVAIDHPHTYVVRCCHLVRASKDLAQTSYFMASNSLHLTTMCLQYKPTVVACFCIHLACKWSNWEIPQSNEGRYWFYYVDRTVTQELLEQLTDEFLVIFEKCPSRLKKKIKSANQNASSYQFDKISQRDAMHEGVSFHAHHRPQDPNKPSSSQIPVSSSQRSDSREYDKRERDRQLASLGSHSQHRDGHHRSSHHMGHPQSSSALLKPHAGAPVPNKMPHPGQHRSSMSHHPRPDHHVRPEQPQRPDHQVRPEQQQRADYQQRQERQSRPEHGARPEHHPRGDQQLRPDQPRPDHHPARPDHPARVDHQNRPDLQLRSEHHPRPDHQNRPDQIRPDHPSNQTRSEHSQRPDPVSRPDQTNRQEHSGRVEHQGGMERHDRPDGSERLAHPEQRHSGVTAARDQLRREAALQREASRREALHTLPSTIMNHSPAQRTTSGDSAISSSSSTSLTPSNQEWSGFGVTSAATTGPLPIPSKHAAPSDPSHRHSTGYEKPKSSNSAMDSYSRHRSSLPANDRRPSSASVSLDRKMLQETERRQLESFFGKTGQAPPYKEVKKEPEAIQMPPQPPAVPSAMHIKREKESPIRQTLSVVPPVADMMSQQLGARQNSYKTVANDYPIVKSIKLDPDSESLPGTRNGTTLSAPLIPKVEKIEMDIKEENSISSRLPNQNDNAQTLSNRSLDSRLAPPVPKAEQKPAHHLLNRMSSYPNSDSKGMLYPQTTNLSQSTQNQGRSNTSLSDEQTQLPALLGDARPLVPVKSVEVRTALPITPIQGDLGAVAFPASESKDVALAPVSDEGLSADHHHHKSKKKKEKKEKHKHKDKDKEKHREEKKHKSKHKEKDKEKRKVETAAAEVVQTSQSKPALTLKINKANITPPPAAPAVAPSSGGLKLKINLSQLSSTPSGSSKESRKRERDKASPGLETSHSKAPKMSSDVDTPKRGSHSGTSKSSSSSYARQNGLESRGGSRHHMQHPQHYSGSKMVMDDGSSVKPSEISKNSSSHSSTS
ncbi:cyclin-T [Frankliniella occidentalis]|uniref:Cyclin-T n=1 Tax=Frankliniella occidentalis TaxID=133901 RepID=A0A6J1S662_FRAOC|nr:cyclin-T [Frankliniella occidentalis]